MLLIALASVLGNDWIVFDPPNPNGKHVVLLAGDEEYRSEEALPQIAKILSQLHGFKCTVLFSINDKGEIDPERRDHQPGLHALDSADLCVMALRFRQWPDRQMRHFDAYLKRGMPIIALRTSTHAFDLKSGPYEKYGWQSKEWVGGFGKQVLGETWISHWGDHGSQATRGILAASHPLLRGVREVFGTTDVYEAHPPADVQILLKGEVVASMSPSDPAAVGRKKTQQGEERDINDPMMPIVWIREQAGAKVLTCTMGAATDFLNEGLRRLIVNGAFWGTGLPIPLNADVALVGDYHPLPFGFGKFKKGVKPIDLILGASVASSNEP